MSFGTGKSVKADISRISPFLTLECQLQKLHTLANRPFYSCVLTVLAKPFDLD